LTEEEVEINGRWNFDRLRDEEIRMRRRLAHGHVRCLPTARSVARGACGASSERNEADPQVGRKLVERTLKRIAALWPEPSGVHEARLLPWTASKDEDG